MAVWVVACKKCTDVSEVLCSPHCQGNAGEVLRCLSSVIRRRSIPGHNFKSSYLRRTLSRLTREFDVDENFNIREFWRQYNVK